MTSHNFSTRSIALTGVGFAAAVVLSGCAGAADATEPTPGTQPPATLTPTTTTSIVPPPDYYPNETGGGDDESGESSGSGS